MTMYQKASVYVGTYGKYNNGNLFGEWISLAHFGSKDEFYQHCIELHDDEKDPEFMFQDYECIPLDMVSESWVSGAFWDIPDLLSETEFEAFFDYCGNIYHGTIKDNSELFQATESYHEKYRGGCYKDMKEYADELFFECYDVNIPEHYVDIDAFCRDLECDGYWISDNGHVFAP